MWKFTVYFAHRFNKQDNWSGDWHVGHREVQAEDLGAACALVMAEERASMAGHSDQGQVQYLYSTNGVDPDNLDGDLFTWDTNLDASCAPRLVPQKEAS